jgi:hypothetical protein
VLPSPESLTSDHRAKTRRRSQSLLVGRQLESDGGRSCRRTSFNMGIIIRTPLYVEKHKSTNSDGMNSEAYNFSPCIRNRFLSPSYFVTSW